MTHFSVMKDSVTPQMNYKQIEVKYNDGTSEMVWHYQAFSGVWFVSELSELQIKNLREYKDG